MENKNIYILPTDQPNRLISSGKEFNLLENPTLDKRCKHIYITSDEEIKDGDWFVLFSDKNNLRIEKCTSRLGDKTSIWFNHSNLEAYSKYCKKIILTTDQNLIKDGIQAIDDEFLEWFVKNPNCEFVETNAVEICTYCGQQDCDNLRCRGHEDKTEYLISIPKNITKMIVTYCNGYEISRKHLIPEKNYNEEEVLELLNDCRGENPIDVSKWFEQYKK